MGRDADYHGDTGDEPSDHTANKAVTIVFIFAVVVASACPVVLFLRRHGKSMDVRRLFIVTLTLGGFPLALFPLVVKARLLFDPESHGRASCDIPILAAVYESFYYPFVYATGVIVVAMIFIAQQRTNCLRKLSPFTSFLLTSSPWLLGLILVLPVMMAGIDWDRGCRENYAKGQELAQTWISHLLPVIGVTVAGIAVLLCVKPKVGSRDGRSSESSFQVIYVNRPQQPDAAMPQTGTLRRAGSRESRPRSRDSRPLSLTPSMSSMPYEVERQPVPAHHCRYPPHHQHHHHQQQHQQPQQQQPYCSHVHGAAPQPLYPNAYRPCSSGGCMCQYYDCLPSHPPPIPPPPSHPPPPIPPRNRDVIESRRRRRREAVTNNNKKVFLVAVVIFFVCSFPTPIFNLGYSLNDGAVRMDRFSEDIAINFVYWFSVVRWVLLPVCWSFMK